MMAYFFLGTALVFLGGCGGNGEDPVLARVGDSEITAAQLRHFEKRLPKKTEEQKDWGREVPGLSTGYHRQGTTHQGGPPPAAARGQSAAPKIGAREEGAYAQCLP